MKFAETTTIYMIKMSAHQNRSDRLISCNGMFKHKEILIQGTKHKQLMPLLARLAPPKYICNLTSSERTPQ